MSFIFHKIKSYCFATKSFADFVELRLTITGWFTHKQMGNFRLNRAIAAILFLIITMGYSGVSKAGCYTHKQTIDYDGAKKCNYKGSLYSSGWVYSGAPTFKSYEAKEQCPNACKYNFDQCWTGQVQFSRDEVTGKWCRDSRYKCLCRFFK